MAAGENNNNSSSSSGGSSRAPCLAFSSPGPLGNGPPSNSAHNTAALNSAHGPGGGTAAQSGGARRANPQPGPAATPSAPPGAAPVPAAAVLVYREPAYNWQATKSTVKERFAFLFNNEVLSDVHFLAGKGPAVQRTPAHRFVLAVGSAVFDAMFNGGMATTSSEIELPDVEPAAFLALLKFLYSDEVQIGPRR
ncbi:hypothetical protein AAFF_G00317570 [Aldrovandia affinis]|uniref:BTB domain-containing protein n=1 Tax=Aldrovandia affinis TaxID=143900 RepID=A0AAD7VZR3_9TELE|nr:hypothetical protein AAFF_G00317570 [Aldrovandia affinis]